MRILFHHRIASQDGQAVHIEEMIAALQRAGHETILVGPPGFAATGFGGSSALIDRIKLLLPGALYEALELLYNLRAFLRLQAAVWRHRPDVIYERFSLFLLAGLWVRRLNGVPLLLEVNAPLLEERLQNDGLRLRRLGRLAQRLLWTGADHVLPVTGVLARSIAACGVPASRLSVIPNGIDPARFAAAPEAAAAKRALGLPPRLILGFTGFIRDWNALPRLVDFVARHRTRLDLHILVVGDGPARERLLRHAAAQGVADRLTITGVIGRDAIARHVAAFDVAVIPGVTPYASPLKLFEYLQLGKAVIAPDTENIREVLTHEQDALLFDAGSDRSLEAALLRLCGDAALRVRLGEAGRAVIAAKSLTWSHNAERVVALAEAALARRRRGIPPVAAQLPARTEPL